MDAALGTKTQASLILFLACARRDYTSDFQIRLEEAIVRSSE